MRESIRNAPCFSRSKLCRSSCVLMFTCLISAFFALPGWAQTFTVVHSFNGPDGQNPYSTLTMDGAGNLYGTTLSGGTGCNGFGCGTVFKLVKKSGGWILSRLYSFQGGIDGENPVAGVTIGPDGSLFGTTDAGGGGSCELQPPFGDTGCGTVFNLKPPPRNCPTSQCSWIETVLHRFAGGRDGAFPGLGKLAFDPEGNAYGTTIGDSGGNDGTVYQVSRVNGQWAYTILHNFTQGEEPYAGVILDSARNLYGTTAEGGVVYELKSSLGWALQTLYVFQNQVPTGGLAFDVLGNLYGTTIQPGGTAYQLHLSQGQWTLTSLGNFNAYLGPLDAPTVDAIGNVYATINTGPPGLVKFTPTEGGWVETDLHDFLGGTDGFLPFGGVILDADGNIYGTTSLGGTGTCQGGQGCGMVYELTP
jgi:hypothetical protein